MTDQEILSSAMAAALSDSESPADKQPASSSDAGSDFDSPVLDVAGEEMSAAFKAGDGAALARAIRDFIRTIKE